MALGAERVPQHDRARLESHVPEPELLDAFLDPALRLPLLGKPGEIALYIGHEDRHAQAREPLGDALQRYRLSSAGGARYEAMAVGVAGQEAEIGVAFRDEQR